MDYLMRLTSLTSSHSGFHKISFSPGLSVILADRTREATRTDSRNGLGKTTAIALIDFCLGANVSPRIEELQGRGWVFTLSLRTRTGISIEASRPTDDPSSILVKGDLRSAGLSSHGGQRERLLSPRAWTTWLGVESWDSELNEPGAPSFRALLSHFIRFRKDAFLDAFKTSAARRADQTRQENAFLLNLDWRLVGEWVEHKLRQARLDIAKNVTNPVDDEIGALESQLARLQARQETLTAQAADFSIVPEYRQVERRIDEAAALLKSLSNENYRDRQQLRVYEQDADGAYIRTAGRVEELFAQAGLALGNAVVRRLDEAELFQRRVAENRASYLAEEVRRLRERIASREAEQADLGRAQERDLQLLQNGGALEDFLALQRSVAEAETQVNEVRQQIELLRNLRQREAELKSEALGLQARTNLDLEERFERRARIVARFSEIMELLYGEPADLKVTSGKAGFSFKASFPRTQSDGASLMAIFAYDIALSEDLARQERGPGFLIHDSGMFADVDERQRARAIELGAESARRWSYQYVIALNSDGVPWSELRSVEEFDDAVVCRLSDGDPSGGLLGERLAPESGPAAPDA